jgi:hypothetical protein
LPQTSFVSGLAPRPAPGWFAHVDDDDRFAFGCDLFDGACFFEAHELWESGWLARGGRVGEGVDDERGREARLLRSLIHLAAAGVKLLANNADSRRRHVAQARALLTGLADVDVARLDATLDVVTIVAAADALDDGARPSLAPGGRAG